MFAEVRHKRDERGFDRVVRAAVGRHSPALVSPRFADRRWVGIA